MGKVAAGAVLATTLLLIPTVSSAQGVKVSKKNQPEKQIVEKAPVVESDSDTTITWDGFMGGPNLEPDPEWLEISEEEIQKYIQEYIENHKEDFIERLKNEKIDEQAFNIVQRITGHNGADGSAVLFGDPDHGVGGSDLVDNKSILITGPFLQTAGPYFTAGYLFHFVQIQFIVQFIVFHG